MKRFRRLDHQVHDEIMRATDRARGISVPEISKKLGVVVPRLYPSLNKLEDAALIESRWEGERWPNGDKGAEPATPTKANQARLRYYRLTRETRQTLGARLHESLS